MLRLVLPVPETIVPRIRTAALTEVRVATLGRGLQGKVARFSGQVQFSTAPWKPKWMCPTPIGC